VSDSVDQVRAIAESLGGLVEQLSSSGNAEQAQATMTIRVPQDEFFTALERIEDLGEVQNRQVGSDDVSEEFIDLEARLASAQREETSLLGLLERANSVHEAVWGAAFLIGPGVGHGYHRQERHPVVRRARVPDRGRHAALEILVGRRTTEPGSFWHACRIARPEPRALA